MDKQILGQIKEGKFLFKVVDKDGNEIESVWNARDKCCVIWIWMVGSSFPQTLQFEPMELKEAIEFLENIINNGI